MAKKNNPLINISIHGSRRQIGHKIGALLQKYIKKSANNAYDKLNSEQREWLLSSWQITKKHFPQAVEEIKGISEGSKISTLSIFTAYCEELDEFSNGCTDIIAMPDATKHHEILIGHNNDEISYEPIVIKSISSDGHSVLGFSLSGIGYSVGFNSAGISFTGNHLSQNDIKEGVPRLILFGEMLRSHTFDEAIKIASHPARASSYNNIIASPKRIISLEGSGNYMSPINIKNGVFAHANHYLSNIKKKVENADKTDLKDSKSRVKRAEELLNKSKGEHDISTFHTILSDHKFSPYCICNHKDKGGVETIFSVIVRLEAREIYYANDKPCLSNWHKFKF